VREKMLVSPKICSHGDNLQGTAKVVSFCVVFKKSAAEQCLAEVVSFWLPTS